MGIVGFNILINTVYVIRRVTDDIFTGQMTIQYRPQSHQAQPTILHTNTKNTKTDIPADCLTTAFLTELTS